jgi:hypothetical protein
VITVVAPLCFVPGLVVVRASHRRIRPPTSPSGPEAPGAVAVGESSGGTGQAGQVVITSGSWPIWR